MMQNRILIRCDAGTHIGMGHAMRCLALAEMLKSDFQIHFVLQRTTIAVHELIQSYGYSFSEIDRTDDFSADANNFYAHIQATDIVVLDGYNFKTEYQIQVKQKAKALVCIDDLHAWHHVADVVINHAEGVKESDYDCESYTKLLLGLKYVLLRQPFLNGENQRERIDSVSKVFVSMGAADEHNLTLKFAQVLLQIDRLKEVHLMVSDINPHLPGLKDLSEKQSEKIRLHFNLKATELATLLRQCDVAICPASSISLECCAVGIGLLTGYTAENQKGILQGILNQNAAVSLGNMVELNMDNSKNSLKEILQRTDEFNIQLQQQHEWIDGKSPERLRAHLKQLCASQLSMRLATADDVDLYYHWANDPEVRQNSFNQKPIEYTDHVNWFSAKVNSDKNIFLLFLDKEDPVGQLRFDLNNGVALVNYSIAKTHRGKGLSKTIVQKAVQYLFANSVGINEIEALVKPENIASKKAFEACGFIADSATDQVITFKKIF